MMACPRYTYQQLSSDADTRIIELEPASDPSAPLECQIKELRLSSMRESDDYEALSYTWGKPEFTEPLVVNEEGEAARLLYITPNLRDALLRCRPPNRRHRVWADAVCIDQEDDSDKSRQIPVMARIFKRATSVHAWLGNSHAGEAALRHIKAALRFSPQDHYHEQEYIFNVLGSFERLLALPWFSRRWVIQEVVLAPEVYMVCGSEEIKLDQLLRVMNTFLRTANETGRIVTEELGPLRAIATLWKTWVFESDTAEGLRLLELLETFAKWKCANELDIVFALCNLASDVVLEKPTLPIRDSLQRAIFVDIDYNATPEALYTALAADIFGLNGSDTLPYQAPLTADILFSSVLMRCNGKGDSDMPFWVCDWRLPPLREPLWRLKYGVPTWVGSILKWMPAILHEEQKMKQSQFSQFSQYPVLGSVYAGDGYTDIGKIRPYWGCNYFAVTSLLDPFPKSTTIDEMSKWLKSTRERLFQFSSMYAVDYGEDFSDWVWNEVKVQFNNSFDYSSIELDEFLGIPGPAFERAEEPDLAAWGSLCTRFRGRRFFMWARFDYNPLFRQNGVGFGPDHMSIKSFLSLKTEPHDHNSLFFDPTGGEATALVGDGWLLNFHRIYKA